MQKIAVRVHYEAQVQGPGALIETPVASAVVAANRDPDLLIVVVVETLFRTEDAETTMMNTTMITRTSTHPTEVLNVKKALDDALVDKKDDDVVANHPAILLRDPTRHRLLHLQDLLPFIHRPMKLFFLEPVL